MRAAAQLDVRRNRRTSGGARHNVVELQESALAASTTRTAARAKSAIPTPDLAPHSRRDVTGSSLPGARLARTRGARALLLLQLIDQRGQCPIEHHCQIAARNGVPEQILRVTQLLVR